MDLTLFKIFYNNKYKPMTGIHRERWKLDDRNRLDVELLTGSGGNDRRNDMNSVHLRIVVAALYSPGNHLAKTK